MIKGKTPEEIRKTFNIRMISPRARRSRCARRTSGVRRSKKLPADQNQLVEAVKDNRSFFLCLFRAMKPNQATFVCLFFKSSQTRPVECCSDTTILKQSEQNFFFCRQASFFFTRPLSGLLLGLRLPLTLCPILLTLAAQTFQWRNDFVLFFYFSITPRFDLHCAPQCK